MNRPRISTRLRLTLVYTGISIVSVAVLAAVTFLSLYRTLQQDDLGDLQNRLLSYWAQFQTGGLDLLESEIDVETLVNGERLLFVRVADRTNSTVLLSYPRAWESFNIERLQMMPLEADGVRTLDSPEYDYALEVAGIWLSEEYFLQLGISTRNRSRLLGLFQRNFLLIALGVVIAGFAVGLMSATRALRPISRVTSVAQQIIDTGRLDARVEEGTNGSELSELIEVINRMLGRIERLVDGMRSTVDMVAHDLRTPITRLRARAELALQHGDPEETNAALAETVEQSDEILRLVNTLLDITQAESGLMPLSPEPIDVACLFSEVKDLYDLPAEERGITIRVDVQQPVEVIADRLRIRQVVANLVDNAVKYCREGGLVTLAARSVHRAEAGQSDGEGYVCLTVRDTGPGLDEGERERVWERMYRGPVQPRRRGLGLGLSLVRAVVAAHAGRVWVESEKGEGAVFAIELPAAHVGDDESRSVS